LSPTALNVNQIQQAYPNRTGIDNRIGITEIDNRIDPIIDKE